MAHWKKNGSIKKFALLMFVLCYLLASALSIVFILSKLLKIIPEPTLPSIEMLQAIKDGIINILPETQENAGIPLIMKIRACILIAFFIFTLVNLIAHCVKINLLSKEIKKIKENEKNINSDEEKNSNLKKKRNICAFGLAFCFFYCFLILGDFLAAILKITDIVQNQHFYNSLLTGSIIYALMPLAYLAISLTREITKCLFYDKIAKDKNSFAAKTYSTLANAEYITSIFCFFWDVVNWDEIKNHNSDEYFNQDDRINLKYKPDTCDSVAEYEFTLFYFMPIKVIRNGGKDENGNISMYL